MKGEAEPGADLSSLALKPVKIEDCNALKRQLEDARKASECLREGMWQRSYAFLN